MALAMSWGWASGEGRTFALATLDMLAGQLAAGRVEDAETARRRG